MGGKKSRIKNRVRELRKAKCQYTQSELAQQVQVTRQTIISIEAQKYAPSLELAFRIAYVLKEPIDKVFIFDFMGLEC